MNPTRNILLIFAITYLGLAVGRIPGLKLNRVGIARWGPSACWFSGASPLRRVLGM